MPLRDCVGAIFWCNAYFSRLGIGPYNEPLITSQKAAVIY